jgi:ferric-dicitrate binding protein FerR (iron transport regulator)
VISELLMESGETSVEDEEEYFGVSDDGGQVVIVLLSGTVRVRVREEEYREKSEMEMREDVFEREEDGVRVERVREPEVVSMVNFEIEMK